MAKAYELCKKNLRRNPQSWLITGVAGFIGSHLLEALLLLGQEVRGIDDLSTGSIDNLDLVKTAVGPGLWRNFTFHEGKIQDGKLLDSLCRPGQIILHNAAISSVQFSMQNPVETFSANAGGFVQVFDSARKKKASRLVYASSAAVYGNAKGKKKTEKQETSPKSLYGLTKKINEQVAGNFDECEPRAVGLRYFNVYGPRQSPTSPYSGVIALFAGALREGRPIRIFGDGKSTRDFVHVSDVVQANLLAAVAPLPALSSPVYNVGTGTETSVLGMLKKLTGNSLSYREKLSFEPAKKGDIRHSCANIAKIKKDLGFSPQVELSEGLRSVFSQA